VVVSGPILIWGAGAIGGSLGAAFIRAGRDVVFVDNVAEHVAAINAGGLKIDGPIFEDTVRARAAMPDTIDGTFETVFLCVKALHTAPATRALLPHLASDGYVVSAQNGLNEPLIASIVGAERTIGCFVNFGADYIEPGTIHLGGRGAVVVGELDGRDSPRIRDIHRLMQTFEPRAVLSDNIYGFLWGKLVYGALLIAIAVTNDGIADALDNPAYRAVLTDIGREVGAVARAEGVTTLAFDGFDPAAFVPGAPQALIDASFAEMVAHNRKSAKSHSGIWRDLAVRKRQTEVNALLTPVVEAGHRTGLPTPLVARVIDMIHEIETESCELNAENLATLAVGKTHRQVA
jgi:2-dehydropantoate 2-reductase